MGCSASRPETFLGKALEGCACNFFTSRSRPRPRPLGPTLSPEPPVSKARSLPAPVIHHPPSGKGDSHHLVSLISSTYGSLVLNDHRSPSAADQSYSPDSVINAWELMEGLDDEEGQSDFRQIGNPNLRMNFVSGESISKLPDLYQFVEASHEIIEEWSSNSENSISKPLWKHLSEESILSKLDPNSPATYPRASSSRHFRINRPRINTRSADSTPIISKFSSVPSSPQLSTPSSNDLRQIPTSEEKIVLYFTSLRGIRKTYNDCCTVRMILRGLGVVVDERDISMDSSYRKELKSALGGNAVSLPQVFIKGKHVGGAEEIKQLNEDGELMRMVDGFPVLKDSRFVCRSCGDARFIPCGNCNGSRKVFEEDGGRRRRCPRCNENGLVRCPACVS